MIPERRSRPIVFWIMMGLLGICVTVVIVCAKKPDPLYSRPPSEKPQAIRTYVPIIPKVSSVAVTPKEKPLDTKIPGWMKEYLSRPIQPIPATTLIFEYETNEIAADQDYKDRRVYITGIVSTIAKDILGDPYVTLGSGFPSVQCMFPRSHESLLASLKPGDTLSITCTGSGKTINVIMRDCEREGDG
jgi:hypothetical protein